MSRGLRFFLSLTVLFLAWRAHASPDRTAHPAACQGLHMYFPGETNAGAINELYQAMDDYDKGPRAAARFFSSKQEEILRMQIISAVQGVGTAVEAIDSKTKMTGKQGTKFEKPVVDAFRPLETQPACVPPQTAGSATSMDLARIDASDVEFGLKRVKALTDCYFALHTKLKTEGDPKPPSFDFKKAGGVAGRARWNFAIKVQSESKVTGAPLSISPVTMCVLLRSKFLQRENQTSYSLREPSTTVPTKKNAPFGAPPANASGVVQTGAGLTAPALGIP